MFKPIRVRDLTLCAIPHRAAGIPRSSVSQRLYLLFTVNVVWAEETGALCRRWMDLDSSTCLDWMDSLCWSLPQFLSLFCLFPCAHILYSISLSLLQPFFFHNCNSTAVTLPSYLPFYLSPQYSPPFSFYIFPTWMWWCGYRGTIRLPQRKRGRRKTAGHHLLAWQ